MHNQFPSTNTVKISNIQLINIPSRHGTYLVEIQNEEVTKQLEGKKVDGNCIIWPDSLSFTGDLADQSPWYFRIIKTKLKIPMGSYKIEEKLLDLLQSQKDDGSCELTVFKDCQLKFTIERRGNALPNLMDEAENALAGKSTSERPAEIANLIMKTHDFFESQEDPWMSFLPNFKAFMSIVDTIAEIHPYVQLAWSILSIIPKTIISQNERDDSINKLSQHLKEVYEYITDAKRLSILKETQVKVLSALVQQTIECAYFLKEYAASNKARKILKGVDIDKKVDDFNKNFDHILDVMTTSTTLEINIVTLRISNDIDRLREGIKESKNFNLLEGMPRARNAGFLSTKACLPGTRQGLITEIVQWVNSSDGGSQRVVLLLGQAGMGKTAIAHTISRIFRKQNRLGSLFCFSQSYKDSRSLLFSTMSRELADGDVQWRESLVQIIEETSVRTSLDIVTQFDELIFKPSRAVNTIGPVVIVIDGLDESGDRGERAVLLDLLFKRCSELPSNYRFVITSRPEPDIEPWCKHPTVFCKHMADIDSDETTKDIQEYISSRLSSVEIILNETLDINWRLLLAKRAEGLFQWANLACNVINPTVKFGVAKRAETFISGPTSSLYQMYHQIFFNQPEFKQEGFLPAFKTIMGALIILREPLSMLELQCLFQKDFHYSVDSIMDPFHSLFLGTNDLNTPVRPLHTSLTDFLTTRFIDVVNDGKDIKTIPNLFYVDTSDQGYFTLACLKLMNGSEGGLRFNICNLETSHIPNRDVHDLADRVQKEIPSHLSYAGFFWAVHLQQSNVSEDLLVQLRLLMRTNLLYLFETLSLAKKSVEQVCISMRILAFWCQNVDGTLASQAQDACHFGSDFGDMMVESTPHLYISALPFSPGGSFIRDHYLDLFPHHFNIELGQSLESLRNSNVIKRHPKRLRPTAVAFSPRGGYIATGFENGDFWLWDHKTGAIVYQWGIDKMGSHISTIVFSPNGESVTFCLLNGSFKVLNIQKNELVSHSYEAFAKKELCTYSMISSDGHYLVLHFFLREVLLYNIASRTTIQVGFSGTKSIFSPNGESLATVSTDHKTISIWSIQKQKSIGSFYSETPLYAMAFSPDGKHMTLCFQRAIQIWDVLMAAKVREFAFDRGLRGHDSSIFSPNNRSLFFFTDSGIEIMDVSTGVSVQSFPCQKLHSAAPLAVSSDCKRVAWAARVNGEIQVQDCESTSRRADSIANGSQYFYAMFSPLNTYLVLEGYNPNYNNYLQILNTATMIIVAQVEFKGVLFAISPNDEYIAYPTTHGLCLWNDKSGELVLDPSDREFTALVFSFTGDRLISGDESGTVMIWNTHTCQLACSPYTVMPSEARIMALAFSPTGVRFLVAYMSGSNYMIEIHSTQSGLLMGPFTAHSHECPYNSVCLLAFSASETHIVYIQYGIGTIIDAGTGQTLKMFELTHESSDIQHEISSNRKYIILREERKVEVWDIDTGEAIDGKWHDCSATKAVFSNSSEEIATMDEMGEINFWDISSGNKSARPTLYYPDDWVRYWAISTNDKYLVLVHDEIVEVWSLETHQNLSQHQSNGRGRKPLTSLVDHSEVEISDGAIHDQNSLSLDDQERTEYALVAWKKALFSESSDTSKGWVLGPNEEFLFWVPKERRAGLWRPKMVQLIGAPITKLNFDNFVHGPRWTECKEKL